MNIKKAHLGPVEEILLGFQIDFIHAIIRPKDKASEKIVLPVLLLSLVLMRKWLSLQISGNAFVYG